MFHQAYTSKSHNNESGQYLLSIYVYCFSNSVFNCNEKNDSSRISDFPSKANFENILKCGSCLPLQNIARNNKSTMVQYYNY